MVNPEVFIVESSFASKGQRIYDGSNLSVDSFKLFNDPRFESMGKDPLDRVEKVVFALQQLMVPELALAADLDKQTEPSQTELVHLFFRLQENPGYYEMLDKLKIEDDALGAGVLGMSNDYIRILVMFF